MTNNLENLIKMIREFYYEKNGKSATIMFLEYILNELKNISAEEWVELYGKMHNE